MLVLLLILDRIESHNLIPNKKGDQLYVDLG